MSTPTTFPTNAMLVIQNAALTRACALMAAALRLNTTGGEDWPECPWEVLGRVRQAVNHLSVGSEAHESMMDTLSEESLDAGLYDQDSLLTRFASLKADA